MNAGNLGPRPCSRDVIKRSEEFTVEKTNSGRVLRDAGGWRKERNPEDRGPADLRAAYVSICSTSNKIAFYETSGHHRRPKAVSRFSR